MLLEEVSKQLLVDSSAVHDLAFIISDAGKLDLVLGAYSSVPESTAKLNCSEQKWFSLLFSQRYTNAYANLSAYSRHGGVAGIACALLTRAQSHGTKARLRNVDASITERNCLDHLLKLVRPATASLLLAKHLNHRPSYSNATHAL